MATCAIRGCPEFLALTFELQQMTVAIRRATQPWLLPDDETTTDYGTASFQLAACGIEQPPYNE